MSFFRWGPKLSVEQQRKQAEKKLAQLRNGKGGHNLSPVVIDGRTIASSFWGKSWCANLERYSDYSNRLPRGRSYVRHSCVIDLQIAKGEISAQVSGSSLYKIKITIAPLAGQNWTSVCGDCSSSIDSMVELLQGRLSKAVMDRVCRQGDGLFPAPKDIKLSCSCPDGAYMCKHVAATLYGVGARLDDRPELLFVLRGVDQQELIASAGATPGVAASKKAAKSIKVLADADLASVFGLDMARETGPVPATDRTNADAPRATSRKTKPAQSSPPAESLPVRAKRKPIATAKASAAKGRRTKKKASTSGKKKPRVRSLLKGHSAILVT